MNGKEFVIERKSNTAKLHNQRRKSIYSQSSRAPPKLTHWIPIMAVRRI